MVVYCGIIKTQTIMKKYILNLFPTEGDNEQLENINELAVYIGIYNQDQPDFDFINWLHNKLPYKFIFYPIGYLTTKDGSPHRYDIQLRDESKRVGTIQVVDTKS